MPRRNKAIIQPRTPPLAGNEARKTRYPTKRAALAAAEDRMRYHSDLSLTVYRSPADGGWYLTSTTDHPSKFRAF